MVAIGLILVSISVIILSQSLLSAHTSIRMLKSRLDEVHRSHLKLRDDIYKVKRSKGLNGLRDLPRSARKKM